MPSSLSVSFKPELVTQLLRIVSLQSGPTHSTAPSKLPHHFSDAIFPPVYAGSGIFGSIRLWRAFGNPFCDGLCAFCGTRTPKQNPPEQDDRPLSSFQG